MHLRSHRARRRLPTALTAVVAAGALAFTGAAPAAAQEDPAEHHTAQYRVTGPETFDDVDTIARTGAAVDDVEHGDVLVTAAPSEVAAIRALGFTVEQAPTAPPAHGAPEEYPPGYEGYHDFTELQSAVDQLVADHPDIVRRVDFGTSHEGRPLFAVEISDNVGVDEGEPEVLFNSNQHAREHLTVEMALYIMDMFTAGYGSDPQITELVDERRIWVVPSVNPDGAEYDIADGSFSSWRKNRQPNSGSSYVGTDLNRNWGHEWGGSGSSGFPGSATYRGPSPFSAPETAALRDFVRSRVVDGEQRITVNVDFHTYSELVLWPYGYTYDDTAPGLDADARDAFQALGREMAATNGYTPMQASELYITSGGAMDWMWAEQGIFAYAFEMYPESSGGGGFYPPDSVIDRETSRNRDAVLTLVDYADCPWRVIGAAQEYCGDGGGEGDVVWADDFESSTGWVRDPDGTDTATAGLWDRADPEATSWNGTTLQRTQPTSGSHALVTGAAAGTGAGAYDVDGGVTSVRSPEVSLPVTGELTLSLSWYLAHLDNASSDDFFRVRVVHDGGTTTALERRGAGQTRGAQWTTSTVDLTAYAGQDVRIVVEAADEGAGSLVEAAVDDVTVTAEGPSLSPVQ